MKKAITKFKTKVLCYMIIAMATIGKNVVPQAIGNFNTYILTVLAYLILNATRLTIASSNITALTDLVNLAGGWRALFAAWSSPSTKTKTGTHDLHDNETAITNLLHDIYRDIPRSLMTNADYDTLNIAKLVPHGERAAITNIPFEHSYSRGQKIYWVVRTEDTAGRAHMDPLADGLEIKGILVAAGAPDPINPDACNIDFNATTAHPNRAFDVSQAGMKFCYFMRYVNLSDPTKNGSWCACGSCIVSL
jgi:hypothetical protein